MVQYMDNQNSGFNMWNANRNATQKKSAFSGFLWWMLMFVAAWWLLGAVMSPKQPVTADTEPVAAMDLSSVPVSTIASDNVSASVQGLRISDIDLLQYPSAPDSKDVVSLLSGDDDFIEIGFVSTGAIAPTATTIWKQNGDIYTWRNPDGVEFMRQFKMGADYVITVTDTIKNNSGRDIAFSPYARIIRANDTVSNAAVNNGAIAYVNSDVETHAWKNLDKKSHAYSTTNGFAGFADQYWETVVSLDAPDQTIIMKKVADKYSVDAASAPVPVAKDGTAIITTKIFAGPRDQKILDKAESAIAGLGETIDYGWFWFFARPMLWILNGIHHIVLNYGVAIIIMTILLRLLMWPLTRKSYTNMAVMQKMQPEMQRIQKLYANDKMRLQMEMMKLYQTHKTSPMAGCLPMLIQIPIFFALYKALLVSVQMRNAHFLWIHDLSAMDPYFILPILMGITMYLQQRLQSPAQKNTTSNDAVAQTQKMMRWMPVLFTVMFAWMPAGLVLYWTVSNIFGIIQMQIIKKQTK